MMATSMAVKVVVSRLVRQCGVVVGWIEKLVTSGVQSLL